MLDQRKEQQTQPLFLMPPGQGHGPNHMVNWWVMKALTLMPLMKMSPLFPRTEI